MNKIFISTLALLLSAQFVPFALAEPRPPRGATDTRSGTQLLAAGKANLDKLTRARTGLGAGPDDVAAVAAGRPWLEYVYTPADVATLDLAIRDLQKVPDAIKNAPPRQDKRDVRNLPIQELANLMLENLQADLLKKKLPTESSQALALARVERGQFVTIPPTDFDSALPWFAHAKEVARQNDPKARPENSWMAPAPLLAAELRADVGGRWMFEAMELYRRWSQSVDASVAPRRALPAMVEALDMVGDFNTAKALIIESSMKQVKSDGKFFGYFQRTQAEAAKMWVRHVNDALAIVPSETMSPLARARHAGALMAGGVELTLADKEFIKAAPALIQAATSRAAPHDTMLYAALLQSEGTDAEKAEANAVVETLINDDWKAPALALRSYIAFSRGDMKSAAADADEAIASDEFLAWANRSHSVRGLVDKAAGIADDQNENAITTAAYSNLFTVLAK